MSIRQLALLDLPYLYSFREQSIGLDIARTLTRGNPFGAVGLFAYVNPVRHIYSAILNGEEESVLGGIIHSNDDTFAKLLYIAPTSQLNHPDLPELIENLSVQAGAGARSMSLQKWMRKVMCLLLCVEQDSLFTHGRGCGMFLLSQAGTNPLNGCVSDLRICRPCRVSIIKLSRLCYSPSSRSQRSGWAGCAMRA